MFSFLPSDDFHAGDWLLFEVIQVPSNHGLILILISRWIVHVGALVVVLFMEEYVVILSREPILNIALDVHSGWYVGGCNVSRRRRSYQC